ncbi:MAG TPA: PIN domain nuclease [Candidatus Saccharimonadales bacterium]|nr:PIN domain nuclease [Candidatus Saccharimonadales bacterium]
MVIVDTTVWIDYLRGAQNPESQWLNSEMGNQRLALTDIILCEVLQGVADDNSFNDVKRDLLQFEIFATGGVEFALAAAQNFRALRQRGHTVRRTVDCLIATFCIVEGHSLLHKDRDFDPFERFLGLIVFHV